MNNKYFFGKYYKFVSQDGFSFAIIDSYSCDGKAKQLITKGHSYNISDVNSIKIINNTVIFNVKENDLTLNGRIYINDIHELKYNAMGPFKLFSMECSHDVYSMYHGLSGEIKINDKEYSFEKGYGYIEGDKGKSFPNKYIWYNSINNDYGLTLAIATIPFGLINFTGLLCFIMYKGKEYRLCTYNLAKIVKNTKEEITIKKGKYELNIKIPDISGNNLHAPINGKMDRIIKENISIKTSFSFKCNKTIILEREDANSSLEYMY